MLYRSAAQPCATPTFKHIYGGKLARALKAGKLSASYRALLAHDLATGAVAIRLSRRLNARIDELQIEKRQLEIKAVSLRREIDELDGWVEDLYGELEAILDRRNGIREQVARLKLEETQA